MSNENNIQTGVIQSQSHPTPTKLTVSNDGSLAMKQTTIVPKTLPPAKK